MTCCWIWSTKVVDLNVVKDRRFWIEHAQHLAPGAANRFGKQGVISSVQPDHLLDVADSAAKKIGFDRAQRNSYTFRSLLACGAQLAFGSDWPVRNCNTPVLILTLIKCLVANQG
ncbi:hypothetical protein PVAP13_1NG412676 [Panicum virgatum]|uniref:Amidohydrolase 3 domain-containing protein n=1 Tax=Panicum virgatum TaxID=38727 RepID=A0A8T0WXF6_PANVG|nr:hypothetical protein PVAP13_1NG412676 [Panicum virgatum]